MNSLSEVFALTKNEIINNAGREVWHYKYGEYPELFRSHSVLFDIDEDLLDETVVGIADLNQTIPFQYPSYAVVFLKDSPTDGVADRISRIQTQELAGGLTIFDEEGDGYADILFQEPRRGKIHVYRTVNQNIQPSISWPKIHHDNWNTGLYGFETEESRPIFVRGDADGNSTVDASDILFILEMLFRNGPPTKCFDSADVNDDGFIDISDAFRLVLLLTGDQKVLEFPYKPDPTPDSLDCDEYRVDFQQEAVIMELGLDVETCQLFEQYNGNFFEEECGEILGSLVEFIRADANQDGRIDISDVQIMYNKLRSEKTAEEFYNQCQKSFDVNDDGLFDKEDPSYLINYLYYGNTTRPPDPFLSAGIDPTEDNLTCMQYSFVFPSQTPFSSPTPSTSPGPTPSTSPSPSPSPTVSSSPGASLSPSSSPSASPSPSPSGYYYY